MANIWETPLEEFIPSYDSHVHPIVGPLLQGGPRQLAAEHGLAMHDSYVDECHMCYTARKLRLARFPKHLAPKDAYGL